jgi:putative NADH-flavin reductase
MSDTTIPKTGVPAMRIAVIAANGRSGQAFVRAALAAGHTVRAGVYRTNQLQPAKSLDVVQCDATNPDDLRKLIKDQDAVVSLIGHIRNSPPNVQSEATEKLIAVATELQVHRIVSLTGTGVRQPGTISLFWTVYLILS